MNLKKIAFVAYGMSIATFLSGMDNAAKDRALSQLKDITTIPEFKSEFPQFLNNLGSFEQRTVKFNEYKQTPQGSKKLAEDEAEAVRAYVDITMFLHAPRKLEKESAYIIDASHFAQSMCPSYGYWNEYYQAYSRLDWFKSYSRNETIEVILEPKINELFCLKRKLALLRGENPDFYERENIKQQEMLAVANISYNDSNNLNTKFHLLKLIPMVIPLKQQEINRLTQEIAYESQPEQLQERLTHKSEELTKVKRQLKETEQALDKAADVAMQEKVNRLCSARFQQSHERLKSLLALFESSKTTGWELAFVEAVKEELK